MQAHGGWLAVTVFAALVGAGCGPEAQPASDQASGAASPPDALRDPHRFDCTSDAECRNACEYGAVNAAWLERAEKLAGFGECGGGCKNEISAPPRCEAGSCVAYQKDPNDRARTVRREACTRVEPR